MINKCYQISYRTSYKTHELTALNYAIVIGNCFIIGIRIFSINLSASYLKMPVDDSVPDSSKIVVNSVCSKILKKTVESKQKSIVSLEHKGTGCSVWQREKIRKSDFMLLYA